MAAGDDAPEDLGFDEVGLERFVVLGHRATKIQLAENVPDQHGAGKTSPGSGDRWWAPPAPGARSSRTAAAVLGDFIVRLQGGQAVPGRAPSRRTGSSTSRSARAAFSGQTGSATSRAAGARLGAEGSVSCARRACGSCRVRGMQHLGVDHVRSAAPVREHAAPPIGRRPAHEIKDQLPSHPEPVDDRARADHVARLPAHRRESDDRCRGEREGALSSYNGHASITETCDRYGRLMPGSKSEAAALMDAYLRGGIG